MDQILREKFGEGTLTYPGHGYASSKPGYTPAHAIDIGPIGQWEVVATGEARRESDRIAEFLMHNFRAFGLGNVIWYEKFNSGTGWVPYDWKPYYDLGVGSRSVVTHKHGDHVHVQCLKDGLISEYEDV